MKKGLILISFAWVVEAVGVVAGFVTATITTFPEGDLPDSRWKLLLVLPMVMIAVAEMGRIPLTSLLYRRHKVIQFAALAGIIVLAGLAFENWLFGFERIVELRLKPVSAATLVQTRLEDELTDKQRQRDEAAAVEAQARDEFRKEREANEEAIASENKAHQKNIDDIRRNCVVVPERCMVPKMEDENRRHNDVIAPLLKQRDEISNQIKSRVKTDTKEIDAEIARLRLNLTSAKKETKELKTQNQIYRMAAMLYRADVDKIDAVQFETVRSWFSVFSAVAVSLAGTVAALVYYARERVPGQLTFFGRAFLKLIKAGRAYLARRRRKIYREVIVTPIEKIVYRDGKEPPVVVKEEVVKWVDRIVLIPRWGIKEPVHINSIIRGGMPNVTVMKKEA